MPVKSIVIPNPAERDEGILTMLAEGKQIKLTRVLSTLEGLLRPAFAGLAMTLPRMDKL